MMNDHDHTRADERKKSDCRVQGVNTNASSWQPVLGAARAHLAILGHALVGEEQAEWWQR
jgi:hypothetical protein